MNIRTVDTDYKITTDSEGSPQTVNIPTLVVAETVNASALGDISFDSGAFNQLSLGTDTIITLPDTLQVGTVVHFVNGDNMAYTFTSSATIRSDGETISSGIPQGDGKKKSTKSGTGVTAIWDGTYWWLVGKLSS